MNAEQNEISNLRVTQHIQRLNQIVHGGNWLAESFDGKLGKLTAATAFAVPVAGVHSVAEIVWHCIYWRKVTLARLQNDSAYRDQTIKEYNFLPLAKLKELTWASLLEQLTTTQSELVSFLSDKNDAFLANEYQPGYSYDFLLTGTVEHDCYHLGQIRLVLKILSVSPHTKSF